MPESINVIAPMLQAQQRQLDSMEQQMGKLTEVVTQMAIFEERRAQDRGRIEALEEELREHRKEISKIKEDQTLKNGQYDEMLSSYNSFKNKIIGTISTVLIGTVLAFGAGIVKLGH